MSTIPPNHCHPAESYRVATLTNYVPKFLCFNTFFYQFPNEFFSFSLGRLYTIICLSPKTALQIQCPVAPDKLKSSAGQVNLFLTCPEKCSSYIGENQCISALSSRSYSQEKSFRNLYIYIYIKENFKLSKFSLT